MKSSKELLCEVQDQDRFSRELITEFIKKTSDVSLKNGSSGHADIIFIDEDENGTELAIEESRSQLVVVSSNDKYVNSVFKNQIADYLYKPHLSYDRFLLSIEKVRKRLNS